MAVPRYQQLIQASIGSIDPLVGEAFGPVELIEINFLQVCLIFAIPSALTYTFGRMVGDTRQGWAIFAAMSIMFLAGVFIASTVPAGTHSR